MTAAAKDPDRIAVHAAAMPAGTVAPLRSRARRVVPGAAGASPVPGRHRALFPASPWPAPRPRPGWVAYPGGTQPPPRTAAISPWRPLRVESDVAEVTALVRPGLAGLGDAAAARPVARRTATAVAGHQLMPHTAWARTRSG